MRGDLSRRLRRLEQQPRMDEWVTLTFASGEQKRVLARTTHFYRLLDLLLDPEKFHEECAQGIRQMTSTDLEAVRRATSIEGHSAQVFGLLRALARGPLEETK